MQVESPTLSLSSLNSIIDFSPLVVAPETPLLDAIALMNQSRSRYILVCSNSHLLGQLTQEHILQLITSGFDLKTSVISEVMDTSVFTLQDTTNLDTQVIISLLNQNKLPLLAILNDEGLLVGIITSESICQSISYFSNSILPEAEAVTYSQAQLKAILDNSTAVIYVIDTNNRMLLINRHYEKIFKCSQKDLYGKTVHELFPQEIADVLTDNNRRVLTTGISLEAEEVVPQEDGLHTYISVKFPLKNSQGINYAICGISTDITERKLAEELLFRFRQVIENTSDAIGIADEAGKGIFVNQAFIELFGYTLSELTAFGGPVVIYENQAECQDIFTTVQNGSWRGEVKMKKRNGDTLYIDLRGDPIRDTSGKIVGSVGIHTDITKRKEAEERLRLLERAIANSSNGIIICDARAADFPVVYVNPAFEEMTGYCSSEVLGKNCRFLQGIDVDQPGLKQLRLALEQTKDCTVILRNYRKDGKLFWNELTVSPVFEDNDNLSHYIGIQTDITERKQVEISMLLLQTKLQYILSSCPAVIYTCKATGDYNTTFISDNLVNMMGYEAREFVGEPGFWFNHVHPEDLPQLLKQMPKIFEKGQDHVEYRFLHQNGTYRWVYDEVKLVRDDAGTPLEMIGYWADITERKQLEQELRQALEKEKELNELKSRFISMASHEFRTPLSTIFSSAELLEYYRHKWSKQKQLSHIKKIQTAVKHMTEMMNDILMIGRADAGKLEYSPTPLDLVEYCHQMVEQLEFYSSHEGELVHLPATIAFHCQLKSLPCCMDEKLLGHILNNLLSNAIKYSPSGRTVQFSLAVSDQQAVFEIQDQGIGIPQTDIPHLYESFHRGTNAGNIQGTGLGLAIVKKCTDAHKGKITVTSQLGVGTTFTVILPLGSG
jgi:PAS domain S-box-containing protein